MRSVLLINPNTSAWVTERLVAQLADEWRRQPVAPDRHPLPAEPRITAATARFGASYIASEVAYAIAAHATIDAFAQARADAGPATPHGPFDAVVVGCFGDPGYHALAELAGVPVVGLAEAAFEEAATIGRFAIVTGGLAWRPMLLRIARQFGHGDALDHVAVLERSGADLAADPDLACRLLAAACRDAAVPGVASIVLGGAAFAGFGDRIAPQVPVPVIDSVSAAARAVRRRLAAGPCAAAGAVDTATYRGIAAALETRITGHTGRYPR